MRLIWCGSGKLSGLASSTWTGRRVGRENNGRMWLQTITGSYCLKSFPCVCCCNCMPRCAIPNIKVHGANMEPIWGRQTQVGPMLAPWTLLSGMFCQLWIYFVHKNWWSPRWFCVVLPCSRYLPNDMATAFIIHQKQITSLEKHW